MTGGTAPECPGSDPANPLRADASGPSDDGPATGRPTAPEAVSPGTSDARPPDPPATEPPGTGPPPDAPNAVPPCTADDWPPIPPATEPPGTGAPPVTPNAVSPVTPNARPPGPPGVEPPGTGAPGSPDTHPRAVPVTDASGGRDRPEPFCAVAEPAATCSRSSSRSRPSTPSCVPKVVNSPESRASSTGSMEVVMSSCWFPRRARA